MARLSPVVEPPRPWVRVSVPIVGGVAAIGFVQGGHSLLVVSHDGRGLIDVDTGALVARDRTPYAGLDEVGCVCEAIGPLAGVAVPLVGIWGGAFPKETGDGWSVAKIESRRGGAAVMLRRAGSSGTSEDWRIYEWDSPLAYGFSPQGDVLVIACSNQINLFRRSGLSFQGGVAG